MDIIFVIVKNNNESIDLLNIISGNIQIFKKFNAKIKVFKYEKYANKKFREKLKKKKISSFPTIIFDRVAYVGILASEKFINAIINAENIEDESQEIKNFTEDDIKEDMMNKLLVKDDDISTDTRFNNEVKMKMDQRKDSMSKSMSGNNEKKQLSPPDNIDSHLITDDELMNNYLANNFPTN